VGLRDRLRHPRRHGRAGLAQTQGPGIAFIDEWIAQWNVYVPVSMKTRPSDFPAAMFEVVHCAWPCPLSRVAVCAVEPVLVKAIAWPTLALTSFGWKSKSTIETATTPGSAVSLHTWGPAADGWLDAAADPDALLEEQAARTRTAPAASAVIERCDIGPSLWHVASDRQGTSPVSRRFPPAIVSPMTSLHRRPEPRRPVDPATMRRLLLHEARVHAVPGRVVRDLGDAILLHDRAEPEPFWNRIEAVRWPAEPEAFDRRLTEVLVLFAALGRQPHVWAAPLHDTPADLVARLATNGFRTMNLGEVMVLSHPAPSGRAADEPFPPGVTVERLSRLARPAARAAASDVVDVLLDAFEVEDDRRLGIEAETVASLGHAWFTHYLLRVDGVPASVARRSTFDGASYLSSIGTARWARGRGLGTLVTRVAGADALAGGSEWIYLGVFSDNAGAIALYERVGYERVGEPAADLLLV
jgi:hypothetical protein